MPVRLQNAAGWRIDPPVSVPVAAGANSADTAAAEPPEGAESLVDRDDETGTYRKLVLQDGRVIGGVLLGDPSRAVPVRPVAVAAEGAPRVPDNDKAPSCAGLFYAQRPVAPNAYRPSST